MHNYKNLKIWKKSMDLTEMIYKETSEFPPDEKYGLTNQIRRASSSIPSNIAEGSGRQSEKEFKYFLSISLGSCYEVSTQLELAKRLSLITKEEGDPIFHELDQVEKMIIGFMKSLGE
ncbi:MAG: four helix bundle protein [Bacteroidetes bacterium]|nr:MAG: four helix bundle protein [Bacteroidota bacterium]